VGYHLGPELQNDPDGFMRIPPGPGDYGYYPRCSAEMSRRIEGWSFNKAKEFLVHYLVDASRYPNVAQMPRMLFMMDNVTIEMIPANSNILSVPTVYKFVGTVGLGFTRYLKGTAGQLPYEISSDPSPPQLTWNVELTPPYVDGCDQLDFLKENEYPGPCEPGGRPSASGCCKPLYWPNGFIQLPCGDLTVQNNAFSIIFLTDPMQGDQVLTRASLKIYCNEEYDRRYSFTAILGEMLGCERVSGTATGGSSTTLIDTGATFLTDSVTVNDSLYNRTDNSWGIITTVNSETQVTVSAGMSSGTNNNGDEYSIENTISNKFLPITSERCFRKSTAGTTTHHISFDGIFHQFEAPHRICLILSPLSLPLKDYLMFCHNMQPFNIQMTNYSGGWAYLSLGTRPFEPADELWQIKESDYSDYTWEGRSEWEEATGTSSSGSSTY